jgi:FMN phosphatase YigB (HAD superfamily)
MTALIERAESAGHRREIDTALRIVGDRSCSILSLDVFDTILWRRVPRPTDLFVLLGRRLHDEGRLPGWVTGASFRRMRIAAEQRARADREWDDEVSLFDIWRAMPAAVFGTSTLEELVALEVETERRHTVVDSEIAELARQARKNDIPVVLVSDTYFTEDQLALLLDRPELDGLAEARIFRSHQHGADKAGGLWRVVLNDLRCRPEQILHVGDNEVADHRVPGRLGVRTLHYRRVDPGYGRLLDREHESQDWTGPMAAHLDPVDGDFGLTGMRGAVLARCPFGDHTPQAAAWRFGAGVLGPVLTGFAEWVARRAHEDGLTEVWCPMREGALLSRMVDEAAKARGWAVTARPLWLSRRVTSLASLPGVGPGELRDFLHRGTGVTVAGALDLLDLHPGEVPCLVTHLDRRLDDADVVDRVADALTETAHLRHRLATAAEGARARLLTALRRAGALDAPELPLVDLGWGGTIQLQLARALAAAGEGGRVSGFYLATDDRSTRLLLEGLRAEGFLGQAGHPRELVEVLTRSPEVLEQCVNAVCGSLVDFTEAGDPVLGRPAGNEAQDAERRAVQDGIRAFQDRWTGNVVADPGWPELTERARPRLAGILRAAIVAPTAEEAALFGPWEHEDNFGSDLVTTILPDDLVPAVPYLSPNDLAGLHMRDAFWPALLAASDPRLGAAARALAADVVPADAFESTDEHFAAHLRVRDADRAWTDGPHPRVRINHNGLSFTRIRMAAPDSVEAALTLPGRAALVRVDWVEAVVDAGDGTPPRTERWDTPDALRVLPTSKCTWLGGTMFEFQDAESALLLPLDPAGPAAVIQVTAAFAMLPQSPTGLAAPLPPAPPERRADQVGRVLRQRGLRGVATGACRVLVRRVGRR